MSAVRPRKYKGFLFVLEGIDGSGKTTVCEAVGRRLTTLSYSVVQLREPTSESPWGQEIRRRSPRGELTPEEELNLFIKDRNWHIMNRILPSLNAGKVVLMDRYFFATGAYQSWSTGLPWREILRRNRREISAPEPDIVFILDTTAEEGLSRVIGSRAEKNQQFEQLDRLVKVRQVYLEMVQSDSGSFIVIDAAQPLKDVIEQVFEAIHKYLTDATNMQ
jgi:dTMP kinase